MHGGIAPERSMQQLGNTAGQQRCKAVDARCILAMGCKHNVGLQQPHHVGGSSKKEWQQEVSVQAGTPTPNCSSRTSAVVDILLPAYPTETHLLSEAGQELDQLLVADTLQHSKLCQLQPAARCMLWGGVDACVFSGTRSAAFVLCCGGVARGGTNAVPDVELNHSAAAPTAQDVRDCSLEVCRLVAHFPQHRSRCCYRHALKVSCGQACDGKL